MASWTRYLTKYFEVILCFFIKSLNLYDKFPNSRRCSDTRITLTIIVISRQLYENKCSMSYVSQSFPPCDEHFTTQFGF